MWEETGVKTNFVSILGFREQLKYQFGQQDLYYVCLLEPKDGDETIDIQMPDEIAEADWIPLEKMSHFRFTNLGRNVGRILTNNGSLDLNKLPLGDVFRDSSFSQEQFKLMGTPQNFYSSHYMRRVGDLIK